MCHAARLRLAAAEVGERPRRVAQHRHLRVRVELLEQRLERAVRQHEVAALGRVAGDVAERPDGLLAHVVVRAEQQLDEDRHRPVGDDDARVLRRADAMFVSAHALSNCSIGLSPHCRNCTKRGTTPAAITSSIGGERSMLSSLRNCVTAGSCAFGSSEWTPSTSCCGLASCHAWLPTVGCSARHAARRRRPRPRRRAHVAPLLQLLLLLVLADRDRSPLCLCGTRPSAILAYRDDPCRDDGSPSRGMVAGAADDGGGRRRARRRALESVGGSASSQRRGRALPRSRSANDASRASRAATPLDAAYTGWAALAGAHALARAPPRPRRRAIIPPTRRCTWTTSFRRRTLTPARPTPATPSGGANKSRGRRVRRLQRRQQLRRHLLQVQAARPLGARLPERDGGGGAGAAPRRRRRRRRRSPAPSAAASRRPRCRRSSSAASTRRTRTRSTSTSSGSAASTARSTSSPRRDRRAT